MPRLIDHDERRVEIAEAAWQIVRRDGVAGVSVRAVAAETDLATASLRRAFPTQAALLTFCFELVVERATERIGRTTERPSPGSVRERAERVLLEVLPLDQERHAEMQVWLAFAASALSDPELAPVYARGHDGLRDLCRSVVESLTSDTLTSDTLTTDTLMADSRGTTWDEVALEVETTHLHALVDGLAMHLVARPAPEQVNVARQTLAAHLDRLTLRRPSRSSRR